MSERGAGERGASGGAVRVFAPASIANLGPGFDCLGVALDGPGDVVTARRRDGGRPGVEITAITGDAGGIPLAAEENCAGRAALAVLRQIPGKAGREVSVEMTIHKGLPRGSGLGSSAASAVAGAVAAHLLLDSPVGRHQLLDAALEGEAVASGGRHADNLAASLLGGFTIVRSHDPLDVIRLEAPPQARFVVVLPEMEISTRYARSILPETVPLADAVSNAAHAAALVAAVARANVADLGRAIVDRVIEPARRHLIPGFDEVKRAALEAGACGASISGAGPAVFAVTTPDKAEAVAAAMHAAFSRHGLGARHFICPPDNRGARRVDA
ncbi:MAG TPA: homoserine kinase [Candidatus Polarisedimenticolia bacterium]|nr:homoserine kinase [Candidatus Polarisedimenticolia bacterium]